VLPYPVTHLVDSGLRLRRLNPNIDPAHLTVGVLNAVGTVQDPDVLDISIFRETHFHAVCPRIGSETHAVIVTDVAPGRLKQQG
jgi:hypothetical protein